jgi:hypothetical protein
MRIRHVFAALAAIVAGVGLAAENAGNAGAVATSPAQSAGPAPAITASPAFTAAQLTALPTTGWLTNGGNLYNQR